MNDDVMRYFMNAALQFETCLICAQEKLACDGGRTTLLSNSSIRALLTNPPMRTDFENEMVIMSECLERRGEEIGC